MTDKKQNESKPTENKASEEKSAQGFSTSISLNSPTKKSPSDEAKQPVINKKSAPANEKKPAMKTPEKKSTTTVPNNIEKKKQKLSKIAILALIIALLACIGVGYLYYWAMQQHTATQQSVLQKTEQHLANSELKIKQQVNQLLTQQKAGFAKQLSNNIATIEKDSQFKISQLEKEIAQLSQNQPSDWLVHEAEYLIRIATRTLWLEHDTRAAVSLLQDADMRIKELENPAFLPIRQLIREDITQLNLMPSIDSEDVILTLMAMNNQLKSLPVKSERIPTDFVTQVDLELSENIADWQENLDKTWQYFADSFFKISDKTGTTEALLSPQFQQNLRENLSLKLQLAKWAASERKQKIYNQTLIEIQQWLNDYFDMNEIENKNFHQSIQALKSEIVSYDYPSTLSSLKAIRKALAVQPLKPIIDSLEQETNVKKPLIDAPKTEVESELPEKQKSTSEAI